MPRRRIEELACVHPFSCRATGKALPERAAGGVQTLPEGRPASRPVFAGDLNLRSSGQTGSPTAMIGLPTSGTHVLTEFWRDALGGEFRCTAAGTPGTWVQIRPAAVTADPSTGTIPTGYLILNVSTGHIKRHAGGYVGDLPPA